MNSQTVNSEVSSKPYPRRCAECGKVAVQAVLVPYEAKIKHDGKLHAFRIDDLPVDRCSACGEEFFTNATSDAKSRALRRHLGLLQPDEIRGLLSEQGLTQRKLAEHLRIAEESVSRWINGLSIQSRALDAFMRIYFASAEVREMLAQEGGISCTTNDCGRSLRQLPGGIDREGALSSKVAHPVFGRRFSDTVILRSRQFQLTPTSN